MITWFVVSAGRASAPWFKEKIMKYITVKISEIQDHPTKRMDAKYWTKKNQKKLQATSLTANMGCYKISFERK